MSSVLSRAISHRFASPARPFRVETSDGVPLVGSRVGDAPPALVLCHGFSGWHRKPGYGRVTDVLSRWFTVYGFDFRGHGGSGGVSTWGDLEIHDVQAVVELARADGRRRVATLGSSMGAVAAVRHAGLIGGVDAVVAASTPSRWDGHHSRAVERMRWMAGTPRGRRMARLAGLRFSEEWAWPQTPEEVVGEIAPTPLLLVHGRDDHFFDEEEAWRLYRRAGAPTTLLLASRFGHGEDGFDAVFAERVARWVHGAWGVPWPG